MERQQLIDTLLSRPFHPFRIYVTDGATYAIRHPDLVLVTPRSALVGVPEGDRPGPAVERVNMVDLDHITRLEPVEQPASQSL